jgi:tetratricopeptide (TPR) repeat protein
MSFLKLFSGKPPEVHEQKGDELVAADLWGKAKVEYERALAKQEQAAPQKYDFITRLQDKIRHTKEALANNHKQSADSMLEAGFYDDARELYHLSLELTEDTALKTHLEEKLKQLDFRLDQKIEENLPHIDAQEEKNEAAEYPKPDEQGDEYFRALCGALPEDVQKAYLSYGANFKNGYLALNRGDFELAADYLTRALEENRIANSHIPLELATAYLNMDRHSEAQLLLERFIENQPRALPAYQLLCEIFWEKQEFYRAETLLASVPEELTESVAVYALKGETLFQAGNLTGAKEFYRNFLKTYGWKEIIARALAKTHEALNELANARSIYREIMDHCSSCHARIDPFIKQRYADLCFDSGLFSTDVLEIYLSLAQELPDNAPDYLDRVSRIYAARGNDAEARRFRAIAGKLALK